MLVTTSTKLMRAEKSLPTAGDAVMLMRQLMRAERSLPTAGSGVMLMTQLMWAELSPPTAGSAVLLMTKLMRAEQSLPLPKAGSNATKQDCVVLLREMKGDHQDKHNHTVHQCLELATICVAPLAGGMLHQLCAQPR